MVQYALRMLAGGVEWGTVGEWVSGIGALAAAMVAVVVPLVIGATIALNNVADAASREAAERTRRSRMVSAWADRTEPQHNTPKLIVLNTGPEVIFEWRTTFWIMDGCRTDGFVHEHKWAKAEDHLERSSLAPGVVRSIMITNLVSGSGGRSDVHGPGRTAMAAHRHRGSPCASDMSGLLVESCSARCPRGGYNSRHERVRSRAANLASQLPWLDGAEAKGADDEIFRPPCRFRQVKVDTDRTPTAG